jgi:hypothetical protein
MKEAFAFDRDRTLEWGNPSGPTTKEHLLKLRDLGYAIGGSGGQSPEEQMENWRGSGIEPDFMVNKMDLSVLNQRYKAVTHVGDDVTDKEIAESTGANYITPEEFVNWIERQ